MASPLPQSGRSRLVPAPAANLCLEFTDTRYWRRSAQPAETLHDLGDALAWSEAKGVITPAEAVMLGQWREKHPPKAKALFNACLAAREAIYGLFAKLGSQGEVEAEDLTPLNRLFDEAPQRTEISRDGDAFAWQVTAAEPTPASLLTPVLWSAADLLVGSRLDRVHRCANEKCGGLFLDDSKSGTRRWCMMSVCGNRAKAHRHYLRKTGKID